jgi:ATP-binding cassette subfamily B protein
MNLRQNLIKLSKNNLINILLGTFLVSLTIFLDVIQPIITKNIIDDGIIGKNFSVVLSMGYILFFCIFIKLFLDYYSNITILKVSKNLLMNINKLLMSSLFNKNRTFYSKNTSGDLVEKTLEVWNLEESISADTIYSLISILNLFVTIAILFTYSIPITIFITIGSILIMFVIKIQSKKLIKLNQQYFNDSSEVTEKLSENIYGIDEITNLNVKSFFLNRFLKAVSNKLDSFTRLSKTRFFTTSTVSGLTSLMYLATLLLVGYEIVSKDKMSIGTYTLIISYSTKIMSPIIGIGNIINELQPLKVIYNRLKDLVETDNLSNTNELKIIDDNEILSLEIKNITFSYIEGQNVFKNLSMNFQKGCITQIKGHNGTGKSTLFKLFLKYYNNYNGIISINGIDIKILSTSNIIFQTLQNPYIFSLSIKDNIILEKDFNQELYYEMIDTLALNRVFSQEDLFSKNPVEANGTSLSGGQIKLIELARIYYRNSKIILLDEISANLDTEMSSILVQSIKNLSKDKIIIIIDHSDLFNSISNNIYTMEKNYE